MPFKLRAIITIIAAPILLVVSLNIEVLAAGPGWDRILAVGYPSVIEALTRPWAFALAAYIVGVACGVWLHWLAVGAYRRLFHKPEPEDRLFALVDDCRQAVAEYYQDDKENNFRNFIITKPSYLAIRSYLSTDTLKSLERLRTVMVSSGGALDPYAQTLLVDLDRIESHRAE
ncbi:hypothetical protein [Marivita sp. S2033]|uniref:hypothetical protein n=1 Tax=Marivita sp. S2033 TaxID=3373187 RepID=UPI00398230C6